MALGNLERLVMDILWDGPEESFTVRDVATHFPDHAYTTIMTVLARLVKKGFVKESTDARAHRFQATASRESYLSSLMAETLSTAPDRRAVLANFAQMMSKSDAETLRRSLRAKDSP